MTCQEAVEWMHRYVDHDLNEEESSLLLEHIRHCRECADIMETLVDLSDRLENLPKVTPRFSLVDSILPDLEAIDMARKIETLSFPERVEEKELSESGNLPHRSSRDRSSRRSRLYRTGSLGLAAAFILGVFIYQYQPTTIPDAEIAPKTSQNDSQPAQDNGNGDSAEDDVSKQDLQISEDMTLESPNDSSPSRKQSDDTVDVRTSDSSSRGSDNRSGNAKDNRQDQSSANSPSSKSGTTSQPDEVEREPVNPNKEVTGEEGVNEAQGNQGLTVPSEEGGNEPATTDEPVDNGRFKNDSNNNYFMMVEPSEKDQSEDANGASGAMMKDDLEKPDMEEWRSPGGNFVARLADGHLSVYEIHPAGRTLVAERTIQGSWVKGTWSDDGKKFTYETEQNGASSTHSIEITQTAE